MPEAGDILVSVIAGTPDTYALRVIPNTYQIVFDTYEDAQAHADRYARWCQVDVWIASRGDGFAPAARHRQSARID